MTHADAQALSPPVGGMLGDIGVLTAQPTPFPAVVCYQSNRDELRRRIIQWLEAEIIPDGWFSKGSNYSEILDKYFKVTQHIELAAYPQTQATSACFPPNLAFL